MEGQRKQRIVGHGGCGTGLIREATCRANDLLRESASSRATVAAKLLTSCIIRARGLLAPALPVIHRKWPFPFRRPRTGPPGPFSAYRQKGPRQRKPETRLILIFDRQVRHCKT